MKQEAFIERVIKLAAENVDSNHGGPFGAIVVKDQKVISVGRNEVTATNDPTAHAEIQAIRGACRYLNDFQLTDCEIYTSCEPCPMCMGAIYWARPKAVYYACTKEAAAKIGFDDEFIFEQLYLPQDQRVIKMKQIVLPGSDVPFRKWQESNHKIKY
ncbi:MAG: nucleoside deaminase [Alicyclobacillus herbarius]|uniref:nucleoside deaminase n=1 Tax=Alicyclobacillus herbarius TaxID=122960 RepID=UPI00047B5933|nr:nucleoside deaminase [Alicyclobacillus herbarius]MCL6631553.1 nucleoside deaminase [Alicyclobacillus herbarius]